MNKPHGFNQNEDSGYLLQLVYKYLDGIISPEELSELQEKIRSQQDFRKLFFEVVVQDQYIHEIISTDLSGIRRDNITFQREEEFSHDVWQALAEYEKNADTIEVVRPVAEPECIPVEKYRVERQKVSKFTIFSAIVPTAAMLLLLLYVWLVPTDPPIVASLGYTVDAVWGPSSPKKEVGEDLRKGSYYLERGLAQVVFDNGVRATLEGPAIFDLHSCSAMELISGKLVANVNRDGAGFSVKTPSTKVLDLGTEFGVNVDEVTGNSDVHVFEGEVMLYPRNTVKKISILQGKAKRVALSGQDKDIANNQYAFVRQQEFNAKVKAQQGDSYHRWLAYSYRLRRDRSLVAYYTFESVSRSHMVLENMAASTEGRLNGFLESMANEAPATQAEGRWPQKEALKFDRQKKQFIRVSTDPAFCISGSLTVAAWIKCDDLSRMGIIVSNRDEGKVNYQMGCFGKFEQGGLSTQSIQFIRYNKLYDQEYSVSWRDNFEFTNKWMLVAVTHDNKIARFYLNGQLVGEKPHDYYAEPVLADLYIGTPPNVGGQNYDFQMFNGLMGELAIFKKVLSDIEIREMYIAGQP